MRHFGRMPEVGPNQLRLQEPRLHVDSRIGFDKGRVKPNWVLQNGRLEGRSFRRFCRKERQKRPSVSIRNEQTSKKMTMSRNPSNFKTTKQNS